ncbi:glycoside hydrolase family 5 protein [Spartinivicinus ruber]|uniref:glycoside hydrolase family 5 protein n=1 Tax=Spartinivicinus ruber TaxID=2683272 RepID=UPI0013D84855|nr:cellulase family glycosylhydrolase [Spartinivicinus ruber]
MYSIRIVVICFLLSVSCNSFAEDPIKFWDTPQHGGNSFNRLPPSQAYFTALRGYGASWVRLAYDKWQAEKRDFLMGDADNYRGISPKDFKTLADTLERAHQVGVKVVITPLSLPFMRWSQNNGGKFDDRLWQNKEHWDVAAQFWQDLAKRLKDNRAVVAYNIINEPTPEKMGGLAEHADLPTMQAWYKQQQGTSRDLRAFYDKVIHAIRQVDPETPIMVDAGWYAAADAFSYWPAPLADKRILYSFHMYEPYAATSGPNLKRKKPYSYPGQVPFGNGLEYWGAKRVAEYLELPSRWAKLHKIPANRVVAGEFGCIRKLSGCKNYLNDVLTVLDQKKFHWAFYSFREDNWDAMDYELGTEKVHWKYWEAMEKGEPDPIKRKLTPLFEVIHKRL